MQDRQPYLSDIGGEDGTATTAEPAYSRLHNNFIVANVRISADNNLIVVNCSARPIVRILFAVVRCGRRLL